MESYDIEAVKQTLKHASKCHNQEAFSIDRDQEDRDVVKYQKNGDEILFEKIYNARIPTIKWWTRKYHCVMGSYSDMEGELRYYFVRAVNAYDKKRGSFNTCLFTFFLNRIRNIITKRASNKRMPKGAKSNLDNFVLSLDYGWDKTKDEGGIAESAFASKLIDRNFKKISDDMSMTETVSVLSKGNPFLKEVFHRLGEGHTISSVLQDAKTRNGRIKVSRNKLKVLRNKKHCKTMVSKIIKKDVKVKSGFSVIGYKIEKNKISYVIRLKKTKESDEILRVIRKLRKKRKELMRNIGA